MTKEFQEKEAEAVRTIETEDDDRAANMDRFTKAALDLAAEIIKAS